MSKEIARKDVPSKIDTEGKKTAEAHGTVSEEQAMKKAEDHEKITKEMIETEAVKEKKEADKKSDKSFKEKLQKVEAKDKIQKFNGRPKRKSRFEEEQEQKLANWIPKTKLGKEVRNNAVRNIDEILDNNRKILEDELVDILLPVQTDLIAMGQSKGKFGGGKRRAWRQTQRITREGGVMSFSAMAVVGDEKGHIGLGVGKAGETLPARDKSTRKAKLNIQRISRGCGAFDCSCSEPHSIPFQVEGKSGSVRIVLIPAPQGTGLVVANELKKILKLAGIKDVYSKTYGKVRTTFNLAKACMNALEETNRK